MRRRHEMFLEKVVFEAWEGKVKLRGVACLEGTYVSFKPWPLNELKISIDI